MAFNSEEIIRLAGSVLAAGVIDSNANSSWYEKLQPNSFIVDPTSIWSDMPILKTLPANNFAEAVQNSVDNPDIIGRYGINDDGSLNDTTALRLTPVAGTNNATYIAYNVFNDPTSGVQRNWIQPQLIPRSNGFPSAAYSPMIFAGLPSEGNLISTAAGNDGNWVSHFWNPAVGMLLISSDDAPPSATFPDETLYVCGMFYNGTTGSGGFDGDNIVLRDEDNMWRIINDYPHLRLERREMYEGELQWKSHGNFGASLETDGIILTRPYDIEVNFSDNALDQNTDTDLRTVFSVSGSESDFIYGNSEQLTVVDTKRGEDVKRSASQRTEAEVVNRPLKDKTLVLDSTSTAAADADKYQWRTSVNYTQNNDYIRFNSVVLDVLEMLDENGDPVDSCELRFSIEELDGRLIQENLSEANLLAGIKGGFSLVLGENLYQINPRYTAKRSDITNLMFQIPKGYKVTLAAGEYDFVDTTDNDIVKQQIVPSQKSMVEFLDYVSVFDESNYESLIHKNSQVILDTGIHTFYEGWSQNRHQLVGVGEHVLANRPVLGNYESETFVATGSGGLKVLYQDDSTRTEFWTEPDIERIQNNSVPTSFIETSEFTLDFDQVFTSEMGTLGWDVVNVEKVLPLIRYLGEEDQSYRVSIFSNVLNTYQFQENMTEFEHEDKVILNDFILKPTADPVNPVYEGLQLPRNTFTVNHTTPRRVRFQFQQPVRLYGYYKDVNDEDSFVPSIKCNVVRVYEEPVVVGSDLEDRVDEIQGEQEWNYATTNNLPTLHIHPSLLWLADEDGEALLWSDTQSLYTDQDEQQWVFDTGTECYYEPSELQAEYSPERNYVTFNPLVVNVPYDEVAGFQVSFGWNKDFNPDSTGLEYGVFIFYINSHGRGMDTRVSINVPVKASVNYSFSRRRDGRFSYRATPFNDNLSSTLTGEELTNIPEDPNPPVILD